MGGASRKQREPKYSVSEEVRGVRQLHVVALEVLAGQWAREDTAATL